jgi:hypothetical protein
MMAKCQPAGLESQVGNRQLEVSNYQSRVFSCVVRRCYQATISEDREDLVFAVVICRV